jgi:hypothetical protein
MIPAMAGVLHDLRLLRGRELGGKGRTPKSKRHNG